MPLMMHAGNQPAPSAKFATKAEGRFECWSNTFRLTGFAATLAQVKILSTQDSKLQGASSVHATSFEPTSWHVDEQQRDAQFHQE